ncbi:hypothetical protein WR25_00173 [Diploscapter pachys]|uniref:Uncharacterized protein n=1 Tax=Diploscapter pachys TaxID=2018661 RepID=A0A2A2JLJ1_9BILA|nr:hypothetical protein WR25_00173 [Diploscapter pachys]
MLDVSRLAVRFEMARMANGSTIASLSLALSLSGKPRIRAEKEGKEGGEEREGDVVRSSEAVPLGRMPQTETNLEIETRRDKKRKEKKR